MGKKTLNEIFMHLKNIVPLKNLENKNFDTIFMTKAQRPCKYYDSYS